MINTWSVRISIKFAVHYGLYYANKMPLDTSNDLLIINDVTTSAIGVIAYLTGRELSATGQPIRNAFVEIWAFCPPIRIVLSNDWLGSGGNGQFTRVEPKRPILGNEARADPGGCRFQFAVQ